MRRACLSVIASKLLDPFKMKAINNIFQIMDESGDGKLSENEIKELFQNLKLDFETDFNFEEIIKNVNGHLK